MIIFFLFLATYLGLLAGIRPSPDSLKATPISYKENILQIPASMVSGVTILVFFLISSKFSFIDIDPIVYRRLALHNDVDWVLVHPEQLFSHLLLQGNLIHLTGNLFGLALTSFYERRVGTKRYCAVLMTGGLASIPSILFYTEPMAVCGISGGIFALAAGYFTDQKDLSRKEWLMAILAFTVLAVMLTLDSLVRRGVNNPLQMQTDYIGHILGAMGGIVYCRLRPQAKE